MGQVLSGNPLSRVAHLQADRLCLCVCHHGDDPSWLCVTYTVAQQVGQYLFQAGTIGKSGRQVVGQIRDHLHAIGTPGQRSHRINRVLHD